LKDEVNAKIEGLELTTRKKLEAKFKFFLPYARHVPSYKLGRWDGCERYFTIGGITFVSLLETAIPIIIEDGYQIELDDLRTHNKFEFDLVDESTFQHKVWPQSIDLKDIL